MRSLTDEIPKCMLPINGRPLLHHTMDHMRAAGCREFFVIVGYKADKVEALGATLVMNDRFETNNILHSLMSAADHMVGPVMCSYSDIWVEPTIHIKLAKTKGDIVLAVDDDWVPYYEGRLEHPVEEAENIIFDKKLHVRKIGKHISPNVAQGSHCGEFLGLWRMSKKGSKTFREAFEAVDESKDLEEPFQRAAHWRTAYITDMIQHLTDAGTTIDCAVIQRGWAELDTTEDYERLGSISKRQRLHTYSGVTEEQNQ